jgi:hypothetical protein
VSKVAAPPLASGVKAVAAKVLPASTGKPEATHAVTVAADPAPVAAAPEPEVVDPRLKSYADSLFQQVSAGTSFEVVADTIMNLTPDDSLDELYTMAEHPGFVGNLLAADPRLTPHQAWLASMANYIKTEMDKAEAVAEAEETAAAAVPAAAPIEPAKVEATV